LQFVRGKSKPFGVIPRQRDEKTKQKWLLIINKAVAFRDKCSKVIGNVQNAEQRLPSSHLNRTRQEWTNFSAEIATASEQDLLGDNSKIPPSFLKRGGLFY